MNAVRYGKMSVNVYESASVLGMAAARDLAGILRGEVGKTGQASIILATGNSQLAFIAALRTEPQIAWEQVRIFHMDEYIGMSEKHPASFRRWMREQLTNFVHAGEFFGIGGDAPDVEEELARYAALLKQYPPVACVLGIGENGHLAFNDPPADFHTESSVHVVTISEASCRQQVAEGHFSNVNQVPRLAISLSIPALLRPAHVLAVVPESRKAPAVRTALQGPITPDCPASILRTFAHVTLYLDEDSASLLDGVK